MMTRDDSLSGGISGAFASARASRGRADARAELRQARDHKHRYRDRADERRRQRAIDEPSRQRGADHHEAEFAAGPEQEGRLGGGAGRKTKRPPEPEQRQSLRGDQRRGETKNEPGSRDDERRIDRGADRDEVEPEQEAPEWFDRHFDLAAIFGLRQQEPGDEGAERHRQVARRGGQPVAEHHQEACRHEELGALRFGDEMEERPQRETAENDQRGQRQRRRSERREELPREAPLACRRQRARHDEQGRDREILKQQHRQTGAPGAGMKPFALDQHWNDDRGRRHRQRRADRERRGRAEAKTPGGGGENERRYDDLREPEPEHQMAHAPEALERQLEPHREHERDDAEGGDTVDRLDIDRKRAEPGRFPGDRAETVGSERDAREQVTQDRTDAQPEEQRRDHARRHQEQQRLLVDRKVDRLVHLTPVGSRALVEESSLVDSRSKGSVAARASAC